MKSILAPDISRCSGFIYTALNQFRNSLQNLASILYSHGIAFSTSRANILLASETSCLPGQSKTTDILSFVVGESAAISHAFRLNLFIPVVHNFVRNECGRHR